MLSSTITWITNSLIFGAKIQMERQVSKSDGHLPNSTLVEAWILKKVVRLHKLNLKLDKWVFRGPQVLEIKSIEIRLENHDSA